MRLRSLLLAVVAMLALVLAACDNGQNGQDTAGPGVDDDTSAATDPGDEPGDEPELGGAAATVDGVEIAAHVVDERAERLQSSGLGSEMEADAEELRALLRAEVLTGEIFRVLLTTGAADLGLEISEEELERTRADAAAEAGGEAELEAAIAETGLTEDDLRSELETQTALRLIVGHLDPEIEWDGGPSPEAQGVLQQWLAAEVAETEIVVDPAFGSWNAESGRVVPVGAPSTEAGPPAPQSAPQ